MEWETPERRIDELNELNGCLKNGHTKIKEELKFLKRKVRNLNKIGKKLKIKK